MPGLRKEYYHALESTGGHWPVGAVAILAGLFVTAVSYLLSFFGLPALFEDAARYPPCTGVLDAGLVHIPAWYCLYIHWGWVLPLALLVAGICLPLRYPHRLEWVTKKHEPWKWIWFR
jgi:hypothetical protein